MRNPIYADIISKNIIRLHKEYPGLPIGEHIAHALDGGDIYNISDRDLAETLSNYIISLEMEEVFPPNNPDDD